MKHIVAAVFDCGVDDFEPDDMLEDIGLDSMMAMDFRVRINMVFSIDLPVLEILRGVSVNSLADRVLAELHSIHGEVPAATEDSPPAQPTAVDDVDRLMDELSDADLRELLAELEAQAEPEAGGGTVVTSAVSVRGLSKAYGRLHAVRDLDLDVGYGEIFAILGPNGAGKSTTIEILEGHRKRDAGQVRVLGEDPGTAGRRWRARIGIVLQESSDFGMLTVLETARMFARCYGEARSPEELLELVGLASSSGSKVRTLSGGQRRRLDVALGIIAKPELLFLDEPTTGFDPEAQTAVLGSHQGVGRSTAPPFCSPLTTWRRPLRWPTASRSSPGGRLAAVDSPARLTAHVKSAATVRWMEGGRLHVEETDHPTELIRQRSTDGAELAQLTVTRPTLEDAYLQLDRPGVMAIESAENAVKPRHRADDSRAALPFRGAHRVVPRRPRAEDVLPASRTTGSDFLDAGGDLPSVGFHLLSDAARYGDQHRCRHRGEHARLRNSLDIVHQPRHQHRSRPRNGRVAATARNSCDGVVVLHREDHAGRHRQPRRGDHPASGGRAGLSASPAHRRVRMVHA